MSFKLESFELATISEYYKLIKEEADPGKIIGLRYTPYDFCTRKILKQLRDKSSNILVNIEDNQPIEYSKYLAFGNNDNCEQYQDGVILGSANYISLDSTWQKIDMIAKKLSRNGRLYWVQIEFVTNYGFHTTLAYAEAEENWLNKKNNVQKGNILEHYPMDLLLYSPTLMTNMICALLGGMRKHMPLESLSLQEYNFNQDVLVTPIGSEITSNEIAYRAKNKVLDRADRHGALYLVFKKE